MTTLDTLMVRIDADLTPLRAPLQQATRVTEDAAWSMRSELRYKIALSNPTAMSSRPRLRA